MKNLVYKELKLSMHPVIYVFMILFPFMVLIPNYPIFIGYIYIVSVYPILFLGANKGIQSNDILYSVLLPVRKKDIIKARLITLSIIQLVPFIIVGALTPLAMYLATFTKSSGGSGIPGFGLNAVVSGMACTLVAYAVYDFIFVTCFYRNGRSVLLPTLLGIVVFIAIDATLTILLPYVFPEYRKFFCEASLGMQFVFLAISFVIYFAIRFGGYKLAAHLFKKVDL